MLAELAAANAAFSVIKQFVSNGKELSGCAKQISDFVFAKEQIEKKIRVSRKEMEEAAKDLDFIEAARLRDEIKSLQNQLA